MLPICRHQHLHTDITVLYPELTGELMSMQFWQKLAEITALLPLCEHVNDSQQCCESPQVTSSCLKPLVGSEFLNKDVFSWVFSWH